ncbi:MAG: hypothetical protein GXY83_35325 [Rhodopirellula sp.]|nr:hypothetical protein [Rhodopirellula sp.]
MNSSEKHLHAPDNEVFDLLVDGELTESQRRELLTSLDASPDGWRRCALAFLESQCWKEEFGEIRRDAEARAVTRRENPAAEPAKSVMPVRRRFNLHGLGTPLAVAASFLIALVVGTQIRPRPIVDTDPAGQIAAGEGAGSQAVLEPAPQPEGRDPWKMVTLAGAGTPEKEIRLPAREGERWDPNWRNSTFRGLPEDVVRAMESNGGQVRHSWQFVPVPLEDGRRLVIPVDQFDVHYPDYQ